MINYKELWLAFREKHSLGSIPYLMDEFLEEWKSEDKDVSNIESLRHWLAKDGEKRSKEPHNSESIDYIMLAIGSILDELKRVNGKINKLEGKDE